MVTNGRITCTCHVLWKAARHLGFLHCWAAVKCTYAVLSRAAVQCTSSVPSRVAAECACAVQSRVAVQRTCAVQSRVAEERTCAVHSRVASECTCAVQSRTSSCAVLVLYSHARVAVQYMAVRPYMRRPGTRHSLWCHPLQAPHSAISCNSLQCVFKWRYFGEHIFVINASNTKLGIVNYQTYSIEAFHFHTSLLIDPTDCRTPVADWQVRIMHFMLI